MKGRQTGLNGFVGLLFPVVLLTPFAYNIANERRAIAEDRRKEL